MYFSAANIYWENADMMKIQDLDEVVSCYMENLLLIFHFSFLFLSDSSGLHK